MTELTRLLPNLNVFIWLSIKTSFVQRSKSIHGLWIFFLSCLFIKYYCFLKIFINYCTFFVKDACNPFSIWKLFYKFFSNVSIWTERTCQHQFTILAHSLRLLLWFLFLFFKWLFDDLFFSCSKFRIHTSIFLYFL